MICFNRKNLNEIKEFLKTSCIHDSFFLNAVYDQIAKNFTVHIKNEIWNNSMNMTFVDVCKFVSVSTYEWGNNEMISCLAVADKTSSWSKSIVAYDCADKLCFLWETFSGNQIFIVCSELVVFNRTGDGLEGQRDGSKPLKK